MSAWTTFVAAFHAARERRQDRQAARREITTGDRVNLPMQIDEWRKRQALEQVQQDLRERRGRF